MSVPPSFLSFRSSNRIWFLLASRSIKPQRNLRDNSEWSYIGGNFTILEDVTPEHVIYYTTLYNSTQLLSANDRWNNIQPPKDALRLAARAGSLEAIKRAIQNGNLVTQKDTHGLTSLNYASQGGFAAKCKLIIDYGADVNAEGGHYGNALQAASDGGHQAIVDVLLTKGADVNAQGGQYGNALQAAAYNGHLTVVQLLLDYQPDIRCQDNQGRFSLHLAIRGGYYKLVDLVLSEIDTPDWKYQDMQGCSALHFAASSGSDKTVQIILDSNEVEINLEDRYGWTALHWACRMAVIRLCKYSENLLRIRPEKITTAGARLK